MTKTDMHLSELLAKQDGGDFLRTVAEAVLQLIMEADVEGLIGVGKHERSTDRLTWRNGYPIGAAGSRWAASWIKSRRKSASSLLAITLGRSLMVSVIVLPFVIFGR